MQLLLQRTQSTNFLGRPIFNLWAKFELTSEEAGLIEKYHVWRYILVEGNFWGDVFRAARWAVLVAIVTFAFVTQTAGVFNGLRLGIVSFPLGGYLIYYYIRERIRIDEILDDRLFVCRSVVVLMHKEQTVTEMAVLFRRFLEAMKTWGGKEILEIAPDTKPTPRLLEPSRASS